MTRTADYAIKGFLYQFNKTLLEILKSPDDTHVTVEGIIEDIDLKRPSGLTAIQCKYHEGQERFNLSLIYKPILQMMNHYYRNQSAPIQYIIFAHFPRASTGLHEITCKDIETILDSTNAKWAEYIQPLKGEVKIGEFLDRFKLEFGDSFDVLVESVYAMLANNGLPAAEIETLLYPNAIHYIATLSTKHHDQDRTITKLKLLNTLRQIRKTAISRWTLSLRTRKEILNARRKQLKHNLDINARLRYFLINSSIENFNDDIVIFISDFIGKYHFKPAHIRTPLFCIDCSKDDFDNIRLRLYQKGITAADGLIGSVFDKVKFFKDPMLYRFPNGEIQREFIIRLLQHDPHKLVINEQKCDDLFIIGTENDNGLDIQDVNVENLDASNFKHINYLIGVSDVYE